MAPKEIPIALIVLPMNKGTKAGGILDDFESVTFETRSISTNVPKNWSKLQTFWLVIIGSVKKLTKV